MQTTLQSHLMPLCKRAYLSGRLSDQPPPPLTYTHPTRPQAYLPVAWLRQGSQDFELELEGSRPGKSGGRLKVHARYAWLRGTSDDGTYTKVNRLVLHRTSRVVRSAAMTAAVEHLSQVNHSLLSHDNIWAVLGPGPGAGGDEGTPAPRGTASSSPIPALETQASDAESLSGAQAALAASLPALPPASLAARLASELTHAGDEGPSSTSQHAATALLDGLSGAAADTPEVADLKRSLLMVLCPVLERLEGLERKTQALTAALQERMWELGGLAEVGEGELVAQAKPAAGGGDGDDDAGAQRRGWRRGPVSVDVLRGSKCAPLADRYRLAASSPAFCPVIRSSAS